MKILLAIAVGGAIGAVARHLVSSQIGHLFGTAFPWGTLVVNVAGSFAMGLLVEIGALLWSPSAAVKALLATGFLGAFTTFSTYALDVAVLAEREAITGAVLYTVISVVLAIGGLFAGLHAARLCLT